MSGEPFETDAEPGAVHPRQNFSLFGHEAAEAALAEAMDGARLHHAWLIAGPKGVGKATLAHRFVRALLGARRGGPRPLDVDPEDGVARRLAAQAHPDFIVVRRGLNDRGRPRSEITVDEARALGAFFALKPAEGGYRAAIIDAADDLNRNAANAILKTLEEPPPKAVLILISHAPGRLLATIRSRCRRLALKPLDDVVLTRALGAGVNPAVLRLAEGRPGRARALEAAGLPALSAAFEDALAAAERGGASSLLRLAFAREDAEAPRRLELFLELARAFARRAASEAAGAPLAESSAFRMDLVARLAGPGTQGRWAGAHARLDALAAEAGGLSLDPEHAYVRAATILAEAARGP